MSIITVRVECLKAANPFISKEETRYYLNGAYISKGLIVTTDGYRMAVIKPNALPECWADDAPEFILPAETIKKILQVKPITKHIPLFVAFDTESRVASVFHMDEDDNRETLAAFTYTPIDGTFPDFRRVIPKAENFDSKNRKKNESSVNMQGFNSKYLGEFLSFGKCVTFYQNIDSEAPSLFRAECLEFSALGVLMPMSGAVKAADLIPSWLNPKA